MRTLHKESHLIDRIGWLRAAVRIVPLPRGLGLVGARLGRAAVLRPTPRVAVWGALAMAATALIGSIVGRAV